MKKVLVAASECVPFIKTGGLADVIGSLPKYFDKTKYDVRVIIPKYECLDAEYLPSFKLLATCGVTLNWRHQYVSVMSGVVDGITFYLIDHKAYFAGATPYSEIHNDAEKFAFFAKAVLTVLPLVGFKPDVIHCNDWQTGLIPVFLKEQFKGTFYKQIKTIFTIHNMRFQGRWNIDAYKDITGLPDACFTYDKLESYGDGNPFKGGIVYADYITTVSATYAKEIQTTSFGEGLDGLMRYRAESLYGIVNGLDTDIFNPETDSLLVKNYNADSYVTGKAENKKALQKELGLSEDPDVFLIGMVSRLTDQKGFDLVVDKIEQLMELEDIQIALQGTGDPYYQWKLRDLAEEYPGRVVVKIQYSESLARHIYASADGFLMPSMFEPCGLSQLISLRYGTIPVVRGTGGLKDTVLPYERETGSGNGFVFDDYDADAMFTAIMEAYILFVSDKEEWKALVYRAMSQDYSWNKSAEEYAKLYDLE